MRFRLVAAVLALLWAPAVARAACAEKVDAARLHLLLDDTEAAWVRLDTPGFEAAARRLADEVPCLAEPADRALVARYHRVQGLRAFVVRDTVRARSAFAASRRLEPAALLPSTYAPPAHPLQDAYAALPVEAVTTRPSPPPVDGSLWFDASRTEQRPANVPTLFQWRDEAGAVRTTAYVWPTDPLPEYPTRGPARAGGSARGPLLVGAAIGGALAIGAGVTTALAADRYWRMDTPREDLDGLRAAVNVSGGAAIGLGAAAGGLVVAAFVLPLGG